MKCLNKLYCLLQNNILNKHFPYFEKNIITMICISK